VLGPNATVTAGEVIDLLKELPEESAFIASIRSLPHEPAEETPVASALRSRRRWRGWTPDRKLRAEIRDALVGKPSPRPWDDDVSVAGRRVLELEQLP
jgi:hypothetical protein